MKPWDDPDYYPSVGDRDIIIGRLCVDCRRPIELDDPVVLLDDGWCHAEHVVT